MTWKLWLDDLSDSVKPPRDDSFVIARSSAEAISIIDKDGPPCYISFDFDLGVDANGENDSAEHVYKYLTDNFYDSEIPEYDIHSENVCGQKLILAWMESWKKSKLL